MPAFARYVGIDYSGAEAPTASLKGLRIYATDRASSSEMSRRTNAPARHTGRSRRSVSRGVQYPSDSS
jgi:hypothetical protein